MYFDKTKFNFDCKVRLPSYLIAVSVTIDNDVFLNVFSLLVFRVQLLQTRSIKGIVAVERAWPAHSAMRVALAVLLIAASFYQIEAKKKDLDDLESLLENIDEEQEDDGKPVNKVEVKNPCEDHVCGWGKECVVTKKGEPLCECITKCPELDGDPNDMVCSNNNQTFSSLCDLYRQRCLCKKGSKHCEKKAYAKVHLEYLGECKQLNECTDELMAQFPDRMSDWLFQVMRELKKRRELHNMEWEELLQEAESDDDKRHVYPVIWKFCDLDTKPHDKSVSHHELIPITAPVIPMESCIKPFLEGCDADNDGNISIKEWGKCLGLKEGEIQERC